MASLNMFLAPATAISSSTTTTTTSIATLTRPRRVRTFATTKGKAGESKEEGGFLEWLAVALQKDSFVETDPLLQKVEGKTCATTTTTRTVPGKKTVAPQPKKNGGDNGGFSLGGLFSKK